MSLTLGIALYLVIWWTLLFAVLPFAGRTQAEVGSIVPGTPEGAPAKPNLLRLFLITTVLSAAVFAFVYYALISGWILSEPPRRID